MIVVPDMTAMTATWRKRGADRAFDAVLESLRWMVAHHPAGDPERHGIEVIKHVSYLPSGDADHTLDVYVPRRRAGTLLPAVLYIHGGSFRNLSKEHLWFAALTFARRGYVVFNLEYRRGGAHRYPTALADVCAAAVWTKEHGARFGADMNRLVVAGESAGANLAMALAVACSYRRDEPWARSVWNASVTPQAVALGCGIFQVSEPERFRPEGRLGPWISECIRDVAHNYLPDPAAAPGVYPLADPLLVIEGAAAPDRPLPPFFLGVGDRDPLREDTERFARALARLGVNHESKRYAGGVHGFHVLLPWTRLARALWEDQFQFLERTLACSRPCSRRVDGRARSDVTAPPPSETRLAAPSALSAGPRP